MNNNQEIKEYLKSAEERIESAGILMEAGKYNDAISRIYYAFFDATTAALLSKNLTAKTHHGLIILFEDNFIKTNIIKPEFSKWLRRAKEAREEADYEVYKKFTAEDVGKGIKAAEEFIRNIEVLLKS